MFDSEHRVGRRLVLIGGLLALVLALAVAGTRPSPATLGSNGIRPSQFIAVVPADRTLCQSPDLLLRTTGSLKLTIGTYGRPGPQLRVALRDDGGTVLARGGRRAGWQEGPVSIALDRAIRRDIGARLCVTNRGTGDIAVAGAVTGPKQAARIGRRVTQGRVSAVYVSGRRRSYLGRVDAIAGAMAHAPGLWGQTAPWAVLAFAALAVSGVVRTLW